MRVKIRGKMWTVRDADIAEFGRCTWVDRLIEVMRGQAPHDRIDTLIHELLHAIYPKMPEMEIRMVSKVMTAAIWKDGWRRNKKDR
jgi:hypothetical protein